MSKFRFYRFKISQIKLSPNVLRQLHVATFNLLFIVDKVEGWLNQIGKFQLPPLPDRITFFSKGIEPFHHIL